MVVLSNYFRHSHLCPMSLRPQRRRQSMREGPVAPSLGRCSPRGKPCRCRALMCDMMGRCRCREMARGGTEGDVKVCGQDAQPPSKVYNKVRLTHRLRFQRWEGNRIKPKQDIRSPQPAPLPWFNSLCHRHALPNPPPPSHFSPTVVPLVHSVLHSMSIRSTSYEHLTLVFT